MLRVTIKNGGELEANFDLTGGLLTGDGNIIGKLTQTGGMFEPGNSPGTFHTDGYFLTGGTLNIQVAPNANPELKTGFDRVDAIGGAVDLTLGGAGGKITLDLSSIPNPASLLDPITGLVGFDVFDGDIDAAGNEVTRFVFNQTPGNKGIVPNRLRYHSFDQLTGTIYLGIPEPAAISLAVWAAAAMACRLRRWSCR